VQRKGRSRAPASTFPIVGVTLWICEGESTKAAAGEGRALPAAGLRLRPIRGSEAAVSAAVRV